MLSLSVVGTGRRLEKEGAQLSGSRCFPGRPPADETSAAPGPAAYSFCSTQQPAVCYNSPWVVPLPNTCTPGTVSQWVLLAQHLSRPHHPGIPGHTFFSEVWIAALWRKTLSQICSFFGCSTSALGVGAAPYVCCSYMYSSLLHQSLINFPLPQSPVIVNNSLY